MVNTYLVRQPIFDEKLYVYAYELIFRNDDEPGYYEGRELTSSVSVMHKLRYVGIETITGKKPAFINFTHKLLSENIDTLFLKEQVVIKLPEDLAPTREIFDSCCRLHGNGYTLAIDDFICYPKLACFAELCKIINLDFRANTPDEISNRLKEIALAVNLKDKLFLAKGLESYEKFSRAVGMGFKLFQGCFFSKPSAMASKSDAQKKNKYMAMLMEIDSGSLADYDRITHILKKDAEFCRTLLKLANFSFRGLRADASDIYQALTLLGTKEICKWIYYISLTEACTGKPDELLLLSLIRALFMEQMAQRYKLPSSSETMFLLGLFSLIDVFTQQEMKIALSGWILSPEIILALTENKGKLYNILLLVISIEKASWLETDLLAALFDINTSQIAEIYLNVIKISDMIISIK